MEMYISTNEVEVLRAERDQLLKQLRAAQATNAELIRQCEDWAEGMGQATERYEAKVKALVARVSLMEPIDEWIDRNWDACLALIEGRAVVVPVDLPDHVENQFYRNVWDNLIVNHRIDNQTEGNDV